MGLSNAFLIEAMKAKAKSDRIGGIIGNDWRRRDSAYLSRRVLEKIHFDDVYYALMALSKAHDKGDIDPLLKGIQPSFVVVSRMMRRVVVKRRGATNIIFFGDLEMNNSKNSLLFELSQKERALAELA